MKDIGNLKILENNKDISENYKKYKWFFTNGGKLVVGGKSAQQNDDLLKNLKRTGKDYYLMHTKEPGSPFCAIISEIKKVTKKYLEECAIFTGCFSKAWKLNKKKTEIDIFKLSEIFKKKNMKIGTWSVNGKIKRENVEIKLALTKQKGILRAVPVKSVKKKDLLVMICPGKIDKKEMVVSLALEINGDAVSKNELLSALPAGGVRVCR